MIDFDSFSKLSYYSNFETRSLNVLGLMESIFGPRPINPVNMEASVINENWPRFNIISNVNFTVNSPLVPCIFSGVNVKPKDVLKLFCDHPNLTWNHWKESKSKLLKHWQYWEKCSPGLLNTLSIEGPVISKKVKRRPPIHTKEFRSAHSF